MQYLLTQNEMDNFVTKQAYDETVKILTRKNEEVDALYAAIEEQSDDVKTAVYGSLATKIGTTSSLFLRSLAEGDDQR